MLNFFIKVEKYIIYKNFNIYIVYFNKIKK